MSEMRNRLLELCSGPFIHNDKIVKDCIYSKGILIVGNKSRVKEIHRIHGYDSVYSLEDVYSGALRGGSGPVYFTSDAIYTLLNMVNFNENDKSFIELKQYVDAVNYKDELNTNDEKLNKLVLSLTDNIRKGQYLNAVSISSEITSLILKKLSSVLKSF